MPIKSEVTTEDALSINSSEVNLNTTSETSNSTNNLNSSVGTIKSSQIPTKINPVKDKSNINDKLLRFDGGEQQIIVCCRLRPLTDDEIIEGSTLIGHKIAEDNMIVLMDPIEDAEDVLRVNRSRERQFTFDMVFDPRTTQQDVYEKTTKSLLNGVLNGYNATVFSYGATGAGKTYTMLGTEEEPGIMFRTLHDLFIEISKRSGDLMYQVSMSYLEIYNELIRDLLSPSNGFLELREDAKGGVQVAGISELTAETPQEVMYMLHKGNKERTQEPTKANKTSSRSHAVLQVNIKQRKKTKSKHAQEVRLGKLYMIDLAGSERAAHTQNTGKRMVEGAHINRSLLALGNCINALSEKGSTKYVNYRDSKLTRILKDALGGNSKTVMIAHVSPASKHFEESRNTLVYADRAKYIRTKLRRNVIDVSFHISQYQTIIQELAQEIASLKEQRTDLESRISHFDPRHTSMNNEDKSKLEDALKLRESLLQSFKHQIGLRKAILELDNAIMDINIEADRNTKIIESWESQNNSTSKPKSTDQASNSIVNIREELKVVEKDRNDLEIKRKAAVKELEASKVKTARLRDIASKKLNSNEQKEILTLLVKNFEFEIRNIEMQAEIFKRDFKLREQDMVILRLEQHRSLCDTLIYQQRQLITENNLQIPKDLDELYHLYSKDVNEGQLMKDLTRLDFQESSPNQAITTTATTTTTAAAAVASATTGLNQGSSFQSSSFANNLNSSFLSQIQEENNEQKTNLSATIKSPSSFTYLNQSNLNIQSKQHQQQQPFDSQILPSNSYNIEQQNNKIFHSSNKLPSTILGGGGASQAAAAAAAKLKKKDSNYQSSNYVSNSINGTTIGQPQLAYNYSKGNNLSVLSSSTVDSKDMEIVMDPNTNSRGLISTTNPRNTLKSNGIAAPGQVMSNQGFKLSSSSFNSINGGGNGGGNGVVGTGPESNIAKRQTQGIAAIAAQRKAFQHHRELMQEIHGQENHSQQNGSNYGKDMLTSSRLARHDIHTNEKYEDMYASNPNVNGTNSRVKKQVKIRDIVQYKLPDEEHPKSIGLQQKNVRTSSVSPVLIKRSDDVTYKYAKNKQTNNIKRSKSNNNPSIKSTSQSKFSSKLPPPSIPSNYSNKTLNMSISGTSVLRN